MLRLEEITKTYIAGDNKVEALKGISISFRRNEFVAILGHSGCGKTTLLNIIGGLDRYTTGNLSIKGKTTKQFKDRDWDIYRNHSIGFVFQSYNLIGHQSVLSNVELALTLSGVSKNERRKRATDVLKRVGLEEQIYKKPNQLSGGQMQRVAIARALINDPEILLADEPTGALDSNTSIQIMDLLKEIAEDKLVIMVTHNPELADKYANRIIRLVDGKITDDTNPYTEKDETYDDVDKSGKTHMSFFTALTLSLNNLMTKKGRTILTAFAGSIGIIGIALILSLSNGVQKYIDKVQEDTLSTYPITIQEKTIDMNTMLAELAGQTEKEAIENKEEDKIYTQNIMSSFLSIFSKELQANNLKDFKKYIESDDSKIKDYSNAIQYNYNLNLNIYRKLEDNTYLQVNPNQLLNNVGMGKMLEAQSENPFMDTSMLVSQYDVWSEMLDNKELLDSQYDVIAGRWPQKYNEVILILGKNNEISEYTLYSLGIKDQKEAVDRMLKFQQGEEVDKVEKEVYEFDDFLNMKFKLLLNMDYFQKSNGIWIDKSNDKTFINNKLDNNSEELTIVGIIRPKEEAVATSITGAIGYTSDLKEYVINKVNESEIAKEQKENPNKNIFTGNDFVEITELNNNASFDYSSLTNEQKSYLKTLSQEELAEYMANFSQNTNATYETNLEKIGIVDLESPSAINIYPKDFASKDEISNLIEEYNKKMRDEGKEENVISYTDLVGIMMNSVSTIINVISYILIAFVAISLVVSSIMIGIITYISVLERTKEIGILRSIGASKRDISRVFNAETFIIGITAGLLGIGVTILLIIPTNIIINNLAEITRAARLPFNGAIALIIISVLLTMIAGLIPARYAAKKDPVEALRTE